MFSMKGGGGVFLREMVPGKKVDFSSFEGGWNQLQGRAERSGRQTLILFSKIKFFSAVLRVYLEDNPQKNWELAPQALPNSLEA